MRVANGIGEEGSRTLSEALKINSVLTKLDLSGGYEIKHYLLVENEYMNMNR